MTSSDPRCASGGVLSVAILLSGLLLSAPTLVAGAQAKAKRPESQDPKPAGKTEPGAAGARARQTHTRHPDAQWYPDAGFGLFIHWGISSVRAMNTSWPMVTGRALGGVRIVSASEQDRILRESDYELTGQPPAITPNEYWQMAKHFDPRSYDPDTWLKAAKEAGFTYAILTAKHHEGFALWPSAYGDFDTKNYMGGTDLIRPFVDACRRHGLKVGLYFSPADWYFDREYMSYLYFRAQERNPEFPPLGPDLKPRTAEKSPGEIEGHQAAYASLIKGQVEELLTRYGKIDLLWFDGPPRIPNVDQAITVERIREFQPGIIINPRLHGRGDFSTFERRLPTMRPDVDWAEFLQHVDDIVVPPRDSVPRERIRSWPTSAFPLVGLQLSAGRGPDGERRAGGGRVPEHGGCPGLDEGQRQVHPRHPALAGDRIVLRPCDVAQRDALSVRHSEVRE